MRKLLPLLPLLIAAAIAWTLDAGAIGFGAALGAGAFVSLLSMRRPMPVKFGALALAGAVAFGFIAAVLASLFGLPVTDLMASGHPSHFGVRVLGVIAVMLAVLGVASIIWAQIVRQAE